MDEEVGRDGGSLLAGLVHPGASCIDPTSYPVQQPTHTDLTRPCSSRKKLYDIRCILRLVLQTLMLRYNYIGKLCDILIIGDTLVGYRYLYFMASDG